MCIHKWRLVAPKTLECEKCLRKIEITPNSVTPIIVLNQMNNYVHKVFLRESGQHSCKGSLSRHIAVEDTCDFLAKPSNWIMRILNRPLLCKLARIPLVIVWGLNCGFSAKDVRQYLSFYLTKEKVITVYDRPRKPYEVLIE